MHYTLTLESPLKQLVYITTIENVEQPRSRIIACCETIRNTLGIFDHGTLQDESKYILELEEAFSAHSVTFHSQFVGLH